MEPGLGRWERLDLVDTVDHFHAAAFRWWISGGLALELHAGRSWRSHIDTDVGLLRGDVPGLRSVLVGWDSHAVAAGRRARLSRLLPNQHPWQGLLAGHSG